MTAWTRAGRTAASPSRPQAAKRWRDSVSLDCPSPARRGLSKRSRFEVSEVAPFITNLPGGRRALPDRERPFVWEPSGAMLAGCPDSASASALCPMIFSLFPARGRGSGDRSSAMLIRGPSPMIGPTVYRSPMPNSTYSRGGSATYSMNCSGRADDLRRHLP